MDADLESLSCDALIADTQLTAEFARMRITGVSCRCTCRVAAQTFP